MPNKFPVDEGKGTARPFGIKRFSFIALALKLAILVVFSPYAAAATGLKPQVFAVSPVLSAQVLSFLNGSKGSHERIVMASAVPERKPDPVEAAAEAVDQEIQIAAVVATDLSQDLDLAQDPGQAEIQEEVSSSEATDFASQSAGLQNIQDSAGIGQSTDLATTADSSAMALEGDQVAALRPPRLNHDFGANSRWERNAVRVSVPPGAPVIAIVLDDLGLKRKGTWRAIDLPSPMTLAFLTYAKGLDQMVMEARQNGHELLVHIPMEPRGAGFNPGPRALRVGLDRDELSQRLAWGLTRFNGFVGVNNHMGSRFTAWNPGMDLVMRKLKDEGLLFLDSVTTGASVGSDAAVRHKVPHARRDIFLDNDYQNIASIRSQLAKTEALARRKGFAVAIGHPHATTLKAIEQWYPAAQARGIYLVPISEIVRRQVQPPHDIAALGEKAG